MSRSVHAQLLAFLILAISSLAAQQPATPPANGDSNPDPYLLRLTTREVLLELIATDHRGHLIRDLTQSEVEVFEVAGHLKTPSAGISMFRAVDPAQPQPPSSPQPASMRATVGGGCAVRSTFHYEVAYHPAVNGWHSGDHEIEVRTSRPGVKLAYRNRYYAGETTPLPHPPATDQAEAALRDAACYHSALPASILLTARPVATGRSDIHRYFVTIDADTLSFITMSGQNRRVQLDYGICTFDQAGHGLSYMHAATDRLLSSSEYAQAVVHGFPNLIEFPRADEAAMARVALRDRATGNVGAVDITIVPPVPNTLTADEQFASDRWYQIAATRSGLRDDWSLPLGPIGSFGSLLPRPGSFCGDVYELPSSTTHLPVFWNLSSIGSLYAETLNVPDQQFWKTGGLPGVTRRTDWFGIDYHGNLWITAPGDYQFVLQADDAARLLIDDEEVISLDGLHQFDSGRGHISLAVGSHSIHVPYMQGPQIALGLVLLVKAPGDADFKPFDMRQFAP
jgi:hypothetical protein